MRRPRLVLLIPGILLLAFLAGAGRYAASKGFTSKWRGYVTGEFRKRGFEVSLRRLTLDPFRGLVAKEVLVYDAKDHQRTIAVIDEIILQVNYANLARGKPFLEALDLRSANLSLPLDPTRPKGQKIKIRKLNARLFLPMQQFHLASAEARIFDVQVFAAGRLINTRAFRSQSSGHSVVPMDWLGRIIEEIDSLKFDGEPPVIGLTFSGDLSRPAKISFDIAVWGERIRRRRYSIKSLYASVSCRDGIIDLRECAVKDGAGELRASGAWQPATQTAQLRLDSTLDLQGLTHAFHIPIPALDDYVFYTPPALGVRGEWPASDPSCAQISGHLGLGKFAYKTVVFERGSTDFSWNEGRWSAREIRLVHRTGEASGDVLKTEGEFRARLQSTINPKELQPLLVGPYAEMLAPLSFPEPPALALNARGTDLTPETIVVDGEARLGSAGFQGITSDSPTATVHYEKSILSIRPFSLHPVAHTSGNLIFDFQDGTVRLD